MRSKNNGPNRPTMSGLVAFAFAPSGADSVRSLRRLKAALGTSWPNIGALLGVHGNTLRAWWTGRRVPTAASRKLIWLLESVVCCPERANSWAKIMTWGVTMATLHPLERLKRLG